MKGRTGVPAARGRLGRAATLGEPGSRGGVSPKSRCLIGRPAARETDVSSITRPISADNLSVN